MKFTVLKLNNYLLLQLVLTLLTSIVLYDFGASRKFIAILRLQSFLRHYCQTSKAHDDFDIVNGCNVNVIVDS